MIGRIPTFLTDGTEELDYDPDEIGVELEPNEVPLAVQQWKAAQSSALLAAGWNPDLHPRDHHGRFISVGDLVHFFMGADEKTGKVTGIEKGKVRVDTRDGSVSLRPDQIRESVDVRATLHTPQKESRIGAPGEKLFHISPSENRQSIEREGLNSPVNYLAQSPHPFSSSYDIYRVDVAGLPLTSDDRLAIDRVRGAVSTGPVTPDRIERIDGPELEALAEKTWSGKRTLDDEVGTISDIRAWHLTDKPDFKLDPTFVPDDNTFAIVERNRPGVYLGEPEPWINGHGYLRPFVVEVDAPDAEPGRWSGESFVPAESFDTTKVLRVIPTDAYAREVYGDHGWIEREIGTTFDTEEPIVEPPWDSPLSAHYPFKGYRYTGPDVREMTDEEKQRHLSRWVTAMKTFSDGQYAPEDEVGSTSAINAADLFDFRRGKDGVAHITHKNNATALDGAPTKEWVDPHNSDLRPCPRCMEYATQELLALEEVGAKSGISNVPGDGRLGVEVYSEWGQAGNRSHITRSEKGTIPTSMIANMPGKMGEVPGEHRNKQGQVWEDFKADIARNGINWGIFITVDPGEEPKISEGNHRRDAAVELGMPTVPVEIRFFGKAEDEQKDWDPANSVGRLDEPGTQNGVSISDESGTLNGMTSDEELIQSITLTKKVDDLGDPYYVAEGGSERVYRVTGQTSPWLITGLGSANKNSSARNLDRARLVIALSRQEDEVGTQAGVDLTPIPEVTTHTIKTKYVGELRYRVEKLNKRAEKLGVEPMVLTIGEPYDIEDSDEIAGPLGTFTQHVDVTLTGTTPQLPGGWEFLGAIEHNPAGHDLNLVHGDDPRLAAYRRAEPKCDHCGLARRRANTVILVDPDGNLRQVGKACVKDYLGYHSRPDAWLDWADDVRQIADFDEERGFSTGPTYPTDSALAVMAAAVRTNGFTPKSAYDNIPTATIVGRILDPRDFKAVERDLQTLVERVEVRDEDRAKAAEVLAWARSISDDEPNNYLGNIRVVLDKTYLDDKDLGLASSAITAHDRATEKAATFRWKMIAGDFKVVGPEANVGDTITVNKSDGTTADVVVVSVDEPGVYTTRKPDLVGGATEHWGTVGERAEFIAKVTSVKTFDGDYGISYLVKMETPEGHVLTTFASGEFGERAEIGDIVRAKGTVKEHGDYNGNPETKLSRVAAVDIDVPFVPLDKQPKLSPGGRKAKLLAKIPEGGTYKPIKAEEKAAQALVEDGLVTYDWQGIQRVEVADEVGTTSAITVDIPETWDALSGWTDGEATEHYEQGKPPTVYVDGSPPKYVFRVMSGAEWDAAVAQGFIKARDNTVTFAALKPDLRYLDGPTPGQRVVKLRYDEADGWRTSWSPSSLTFAEEYQIDVATTAPIPLDRVVEVTPPGNARDIHGAFDVVVKQGLTFLHSTRTNTDGSPEVASVVRVANNNVDYRTPTANRTEHLRDFPDVVGVVLDEPGTQSGMTINTPRSELVAWSAEHPDKARILDHLDEAVLAEVLDTNGQWNPTYNALPSASYDPTTGDAGLIEITQRLFDTDTITFTEALGIKQRLDAPPPEVADGGDIGFAAINWVSWSGSKGIRRAAVELTGKLTKEADPQINSNRDVNFEEVVQDYGWPEGYSPFDPEAIAADRMVNTRDAAIMLDTLAHGGDSDVVQRTLYTGDLWRGQAMPPADIKKLTPGKKVDLPLVALTDRKDKATSFGWRRAITEKLWEDDRPPSPWDEEIRIEREQPVTTPVLVRVIGETPVLDSLLVWHWEKKESDGTTWEDIDGVTHPNKVNVPNGREVVSGGRFEVVSNDGETITLRHLGVYDSEGKLIGDGESAKDEVGAESGISTMDIQAIRSGRSDLTDGIDWDGSIVDITDELIDRYMTANPEAPWESAEAWAERVAFRGERPNNGPVIGYRDGSIELLAGDGVSFPGEALPAYEIVRDELQGLLPGRPMKITFVSPDQIDSDAAGQYAGVGRILIQRSDFFHMDDLTHLYIHESSHAHFAETDADISRYKKYLDTLSPNYSADWEYGVNNGVREFAPDFIAYAVTDPGVVAEEARSNGVWDAAEIDRLVGEDIGQPDFHKVRDAVAARADVGSKAAIALPAGVQVDQREGESYKAAVRRAMDEVGSTSGIGYTLPWHDRDAGSHTLSDLIQTLGVEYPALVNLDVSENPPGFVKVGLIQTDPSARRSGVATAAMQKLIDWADANGKVLALTPEQMSGRGNPSKTALTKWYRSLGFRPNTGPRRHLEVRESMVRDPQGDEVGARSNLSVENTLDLPNPTTVTIPPIAPRSEVMPITASLNRSEIPSVITIDGDGRPTGEFADALDQWLVDYDDFDEEGAFGTIYSAAGFWMGMEQQEIGQMSSQMRALLAQRLGHPLTDGVRDDIDGVPEDIIFALMAMSTILAEAASMQPSGHDLYRAIRLQPDVASSIEVGDIIEEPLGSASRMPGLAVHVAADRADDPESAEILSTLLGRDTRADSIVMFHFPPTDPALHITPLNEMEPYKWTAQEYLVSGRYRVTGIHEEEIDRVNFMMDDNWDDIDGIAGKWVPDGEAVAALVVDVELVAPVVAAADQALFFPAPGNLFGTAITPTPSVLPSIVHPSPTSTF